MSRPSEQSCILIPHAILIIRCRMTVAFAARTLGLSSAAKNRLSLAQQRRRLAGSIARFNRTAMRFMPIENLPALLSAAAHNTDLGSEWDEEDDSAENGMDDHTAPDEEEDDTLQPENQAIALPSTLGPDLITRYRLWDLALKERQLREGQMNDTLQGIRTGIGYKSLLYRTKIRKAPSYRTRLRSFDDIHIADESVRKHVRLYMQARQSAERLFNPRSAQDTKARTELFAKYKPIVRADLRVETAVIESFTQGLRNVSSAWFWHIEDSERAEGQEWMRDRT